MKQDRYITIYSDAGKPIKLGFMDFMFRCVQDDFAHNAIGLLANAVTILNHTTSDGDIVIEGTDAAICAIALDTIYTVEYAENGDRMLGGVMPGSPTDIVHMNGSNTGICLHIKVADMPNTDNFISAYLSIGMILSPDSYPGLKNFGELYESIKHISNTTLEYIRKDL